MRKILRMFLVCFMALFCGTVMAQTTIWSEDWSGWEELEKKNPAGVNSNYTFTGTVLKDDGSFNSGTTIYKEKIAGGDAPELLIAKNGGSFTAKITMNGVSGELKLSYKCNKALTITAENATIGEAQNSGNDYVYPVTVASGTSEISITFTMSTNANARLDNIKLYQGTAKKPAGLSWGTSSRSVTIGADDNLFPTLSNENNLSVTYSSSDTSIATINANGEITLIAAGKTEITAAFAGNDEYEEGKVSYTLTVNEKTTPADVTEITVSKALEIINALESGKTTTEEYKVKGFIVGTPDFQRRADNSLYGNVNLTIADEKGGTTTLTIYRGKYFNDANFTEETITALKEGDEVIFQGKLQKYVKDEVITPELTSCYLISVNGKTEPETPAVTISEVSDINEFKAQPKGKPYKMTLENAQVVYSWTSTNGNVQSYVRDETGALCFFFAKGYEAVSDKFAVNNILNGSIVMQSNNSQTRADAIEQSNENTLTSTTGTAAEPVKIDATKVSEYLNDLVLLENVTIEEKESKYYVGDVQLYNQFHIEGFNDLSSFVGEGKNVKGIAVIYQPKTGDPVYEIYPIEITSQGGGETPAGTKAYWDLATWDNVDVTSKVTVDGLTYYGESKSAFSTGNNTFTKGDSSIKCTGRIKMGGGSTFKTDSYSRVFAFNATKGQNVIVFGTHGSSDGDPRTIYLSQKASDTNRDTETAFASQKYEAGEKLWFEGTVPEDGTVYVWADNNMGIYMISVGYTFEELAETSGIETVSINSIKNNIRYNLAGQRVDENYKGVVIMNGKKYVVK